MRATIVEGTPEEITEYLRLVGHGSVSVVGPSRPVAVTPMFRGDGLSVNSTLPDMSRWEPVPELVKPWAEARVGKALTMSNHPTGPDRRCEVIRWSQAATGIRLHCADGGYTTRPFAMKVLREIKEAS